MVIGVWRQVNGSGSVGLLIDALRYYIGNE